MADQQRSVIVTAIVLAVILGGALVWLLNRTPAQQLATQAPQDATAQTPAPQEDGTNLTAETVERLAQAGISPTEQQQLPAAPSGSVAGVAATAPTGPADTLYTLALAALMAGTIGVFTLRQPRF